MIYGGAAGGGKTYGLLMEPLRHVRNPHFDAVAFRRTTPQILKPGAIWDQSFKLYKPAGARPNLADHKWTFPSGATVLFSHMQYEDNKYDWQGSEMALQLWDELTHFTPGQFWYLQSRLRSTSGIVPYVRAGCNPDPDSWVAEFIDWWILDNGFADESKSGVIRWMVRDDEQIYWGDSKAEMLDRFPDSMPRSVTFIPALLDDNPALDKVDPNYRANLMSMSLVDRERLLRGNWKIRAEGGKVFNRLWFGTCEPWEVPAGGTECLFWDFAATAKKIKGDDPDYTAGVRVRKVGRTYYVMGMNAFQGSPSMVDKVFMEDTLEYHRQATERGVEFLVRWEREPGASAKILAAQYVSQLDGLDAASVPPRGDKILRATRPGGFSAQAMAGNVVLVKGPWNEAWLRHMHNQPEWPHDDIMDASVGAYEGAREGGARMAYSYEG